MQPPIHPNPYAPPTVALGFAVNEPQRYDFEAEVLESDVHRATRQIGRFLLAFAFLGFILFSSATLIFYSLRSGPTGSYLILLCVVPLLLFILFLMLKLAWLNIGPGMGRQRVLATPLILGHKHGTITDSEIRVSSGKGTSIHPLESCCYAEVRSDTLVFAFDQRRLMLCVLPRRAFAAGCFERAAKLLVQNAMATKASPAAGVIDQRLLQADQFFQIEMPDGVAFSGPLTTREILASPLRNQANSVKWRLLLLIGFFNLLLLATFSFLYYRLRIELGLVLLATTVYMNYKMWKIYRVSLKWSKSPDQVLMQMRGVIDDQALYVTTPIGASIYRWDIFTEATIQNELMSLALPGKLGHRVILSRRQFASDNDWSKAKELIRAKGHLFPIPRFAAESS